MVLVVGLAAGAFAAALAVRGMRGTSTPYGVPVAIAVLKLPAGALTALFILVAPAVIQLFAPGFDGRIEDLTCALSRLLFPILLMLGVSGLVVGVLNSYDRFAMFAIAPFFWNVAIIAVLVGLAPAFP